MSITYPQYPFTQFPDSIDPALTFADLDITTKVYADQYYSFINSGDFLNANKIREDHPELEHVIVDSKKLNQLADSSAAYQKFFHDEIQTWIFNVSKYAGEWSRTIKYQKFNVVSYAFEGAVQFYQGNELDIPIGTPPTNEDYWTCVTLRGEKGEPGLGLSYSGSWNDLTRYQGNQFVVCDNAFWLCLTDNENSKPRKGNTNWELILQISADLFTYDNTKSCLDSEYMQDAITELDKNMRSNRTVTLPASGWSNSAPYTQRVEVPGLKAADNPGLYPYTPKDLDAAQVILHLKLTGMITDGTTEDGYATFYCGIKKPSADFPVLLKGV